MIVEKAKITIKEAENGPFIQVVSTKEVTK